MPDYKKLYFRMFNAATDAIIAMDHMNFGMAKLVLRQAQLKAEDMVMEDDDKPESAEK